MKKTNGRSAKSTPAKKKKAGRPKGANKYTPTLKKKVAELIANGDHTIKDICKQIGIHPGTFHAWRNPNHRDYKNDFPELLKKADVQRLEAFKNMARSGLAVLISPSEAKEERIEYSSDGKTIKSKTITTKVIQPNPLSVIFTLTNQDSENFKHKQHIDHTTKEETINPGALPTVELAKRVVLLAELEANK